MRKTKAMIALEHERVIRSIELYMRYLGLEIDNTGTIYYEDEDDMTRSIIRVDGSICKYPDPKYIQDPYIEEMMDVYNTTKNAIKLFYYYINRLGYKIDYIYLTNTRPDTFGTLCIVFANGVKYESNPYLKDSLKYIDMVMQMEQAVPDEFDMLKGIDLDAVK